MILTMPTEVKVKEIELDIIELLRTAIGEYNDATTRAIIVAGISEHLSNFDDYNFQYSILCNENNNPAEIVDAGKLALTCWVLIDDIPCAADFLLTPSLIPGIPNITGAFKTFPPVVDTPKHNVKENLAVSKYAEMPAALAVTLGFRQC